MNSETCFACGAAFECGATEPDGKCWCTELPHVSANPTNPTCLCPACLKARIEAVEAYNAVSKMYADKYSDEILLKPKVQEFLAEFVQLVPVDGLICDMGCGPGQVARYLKNNLHRNVTGVDLSSKMVEIANEINPGIEFKCADILQMEEAGVYEGIVGLYFIVNFAPATLPNVFDKLYQLLKPNGKLLLSFHIGEDKLNRIDSFWDSGKALDFYFFNPETVSKTLVNSGFRIADIKYREPYPEIEYPSKRAYVFAEK